MYTGNGNHGKRIVKEDGKQTKKLKTDRKNLKHGKIMGNGQKAWEKEWKKARRLENSRRVGLAHKMEKGIRNET